MGLLLLGIASAGVIAMFIAIARMRESIQRRQSYTYTEKGKGERRRREKIYGKQQGYETMSGRRYYHHTDEKRSTRSVVVRNTRTGEYESAIDAPIGINFNLLRWHMKWEGRNVWKQLDSKNDDKNNQSGSV